MRPIFCPNSMCKTSNNNKMCRRWRKTTSDKTSNSLSIAHSNSYFFVAYRKTAVTLFKKKLVCYFIVCALNGALNLRENYISCFVCCSFIALQEKFKLLLEWSQCQSAFVHTQIERERSFTVKETRTAHTKWKSSSRESRSIFINPLTKNVLWDFNFFFSLSSNTREVCDTGSRWITEQIQHCVRHAVTHILFFLDIIRTEHIKITQKPYWKYLFRFFLCVPLKQETVNFDMKGEWKIGTRTSTIYYRYD